MASNVSQQLSELNAEYESLLSTLQQLESQLTEPQADMGEAELKVIQLNTKVNEATANFKTLKEVIQSVSEKVPNSEEEAQNNTTQLIDLRMQEKIASRQVAVYEAKIAAVNSRHASFLKQITFAQNEQLRKKRSELDAVTNKMKELTSES